MRIKIDTVNEPGHREDGWIMLSVDSDDGSPVFDATGISMEAALLRLLETVLGSLEDDQPLRVV